MKNLTLAVGQTLQVNFGKGNPNNRTAHVRAIVDDEYVVVRRWSARKRYWQYEVEHASYYEAIFKAGHLKVKPNNQVERTDAPLRGSRPLGRRVGRHELESTMTNDELDAERYRWLREHTHSMNQGTSARVVMNIYRADGSFMVPGTESLAAVTLDQAVDEMLAVPPNGQGNGPRE